MKILNSTKNTVYLEDIDRYITFTDGDIVEFSETEMLRSRGLQTLILTGKFDVVEYSNSRIDQNIKRMNESMAKLKSIMPKDLHKEDTVHDNSGNLEVVIKGHFLEGGGYAKVNRNLALGLESLGVKVNINVIGGTHADLNDNEISRIAHMRKSGSKNAIYIDSVIPSFANVSGGKYKILYTTVESQSVPKQFIESCAMYNEIWVTSDFCSDILKKSGVDRPIFVLPDSINTNHYTESGEKYKFNPELNDFVFISVFGWSYRKGYDVLLKAYLEEFSNKDNVSLLILSKYQGNHKKSDVIKDAVGKAIGDFGGSHPAHIARCSRNVPERDMPSMYRACDAFVLFSRGEGFGIPYCFKEGTPIHTLSGFKKIEEIKIGDNVISGTNCIRKVSEIHKNTVTTNFVKIRHRLGYDNLSVTSNHAFLVAKPHRIKNGSIKKSDKNPANWSVKWTRAGNLDNDCFLVYPIKKEWPKKYESIDLHDFNKLWLYDDKHVWSRYSNRRDTVTSLDISRLAGVSQRQVYHYNQDSRLSSNASTAIADVVKNINQNHLKLKINRNITVDKDFAKLLGYYTAEGSLSSGGNSVEFAFHTKESKYHEEVSLLIKSIFGLDSRIYINGNSARVVCSSCVLSSVLSGLCGQSSSGKMIPELITASPKDVIESFLNGYINGDGCSHAYHNAVSISTSSEMLARQYQKLMLDLGEFCSLRKSKRNEWICKINGYRNKEKWIEKDNRKKKRKETSTIYSNDDYIFMRIENLTQNKETACVYNFDVPVDHSYISGICVAHNCEASLCGLPVISTDCSGQKMFLNNNNSTLVPIDSLAPIQPGIMHVHYWDNQIFPLLTSKKVIDDARASMRNVFENKEKLKKKNKILQKFLIENYSIDSICKKAKQRLEEISNKLLKDK